MFNSISPWKEMLSLPAMNNCLLHGEESFKDTMAINTLLFFHPMQKISFKLRVKKHLPSTMETSMSKVA